MLILGLPWSAKAAMVSAGSVLMVAGAISSSTYLMSL